jgi:hypothetical protein
MQIMTQAEKTLVELFAAEWLRTQGYKPATFQKAIALHRIRRGESACEIVAALVSQRVEC